MDRIEKLRQRLHTDEAAYITAYADIFYYSGFTSGDAALVISNNDAVIVSDSRYTVQASEQAKAFRFYDIKNGLKGLFENIPEKSICYQQESITAAGLDRLKEALGERNFIPAQERITDARRIKEPEEIKKIKAAEELGDAAFDYILKNKFEGRTEREIAFELEFFMKRNGASALSFETIVASGIRSAMPHGTASSKVIEKGELVTMDFGCVLDGYCSDMTRTIGVGKLDRKLVEIYDTVLLAQKTALERAKVGTELKMVDSAARDIIAAAGYGEYFGHALGHSVGIEIHENPCFSPKSEGRLCAGNVITVEPGIYVPGLGGVRIEDVIAAKELEPEILSHSPKELIIV